MPPVGDDPRRDRRVAHVKYLWHLFSGILLCKHRDETVVEYALSDIAKPIGVSEYRLTQTLPDNLKSSLPSIEELEAELGLSGDEDE